MDLSIAIEKYGWKHDPNRIIEHDYYQIVNNNSCRLHYIKHSRTWVFTKNNIVCFRGEDANPEDILEVLSDIQINVY